MNKSQRFAFIPTILLTLALIPALVSAQETTYAFTARLGVDTLAIERVVLSKGALKAEALIRTPRTALLRYEMRMDKGLHLKHLETSRVEPLTGKLLVRQIFDRVGDSIKVETIRSGGTSIAMVAAPMDALPFIDMIHWPFDWQLRKMATKNMTTWDAPMISRNRIANFPLAKVGNDSATVTHPTRGTMRVLLGEEGGIQTLDATATTRGLIVTRGGDPDVNALALAFAKKDAAGRGMGALSGRDTSWATVVGAEIMVEYGTPVKRGRKIWGGLVRYNKLWRTGANRATHFKTSKMLRFGELEVPPGEYTLFSIPEENGGVLIINEQTGQNGQRRDPERDLGQVALNPRPLGETVEVFTIRVDEVTGEGLIRLQWDGTEYVAEFVVVE